MADLPQNLDWKTLYDTTPVERMPWFFPELDSDIGDFLVDAVPPGSAVLDLGTGPGTQAVELAKLGYTVTGTDISEGAIHAARARAEAAGVRAMFLVDNILQSSLPLSFDAVVDRGCFHVLPIDKRLVYVDRLSALVRPRGWFVLKVFSPAETREGGPHRISKEELRSLFSPRFDKMDITESVYQGTIDPPPRAHVLKAVRKNR